MAVIVTYDENGGFWDHVPPPIGAGMGRTAGPGHARADDHRLAICPGAVTSTRRLTIRLRSLKLITRRFGLEPLPGVRANAGDLTGRLRLRAMISRSVAHACAVLAALGV